MSSVRFKKCMSDKRHCSTSGMLTFTSIFDDLVSFFIVSSWCEEILFFEKEEFQCLFCRPMSDQKQKFPLLHNCGTACGTGLSS